MNKHKGKSGKLIEVNQRLLYIIPPVSNIQNQNAKHKQTEFTVDNNKHRMPNINRQSLQGIITNIECQTTYRVITVVQYMPKPNAQHTVSPLKHVENETLLPKLVYKQNTNLNSIYWWKTMSQMTNNRCNVVHLTG